MPVDANGQHRISKVILTPWKITQLKPKQWAKWIKWKRIIFKSGNLKSSSALFFQIVTKPSRSNRQFTTNLQLWFKSSVVLGVTAFLLTSSGDGVKDTTKWTMLIKTFLLLPCMRNMWILCLENYWLNWQWLFLQILQDNNCVLAQRSRALTVKKKPQFGDSPSEVSFMAVIFLFIYLFS